MRASAELRRDGVFGALYASENGDIRRVIAAYRAWYDVGYQDAWRAWFRWAASESSENASHNHS